MTFCRGIFLSLLLLATPAAAQVAGLEHVGDEVSLGTNATNEECRLRLMTDHGQYNFHRYNIYCRGWSQPSGELRTFQIDAHYPLDKLLTEGVWQKELADRVAGCSDVSHAQVLDGADASFRTCQRVEGNVPEALFVTHLERNFYQSESFPTNVPVMERAIAVLAGKQAASVIKQGSTTQFVHAMEEKLGASVSAFAVQDVGAIEDLGYLGLAYNQSREYPKAEVAYTRLQQIVTRVFGPTSPQAGDASSYIALQQMEQGKVDEASALLDKAEPLVQKDATHGSQRRWLSFKSTLEWHLGDLDKAYKYAHDASVYAAQNKLPSGAQANALMFETEILFGQKRYAEAISTGKSALGYYDDSINRYAKYAASNRTMSAFTNIWIGRSQLALNEPDDARASFEKARAIREAAFGDSFVLGSAWLFIGSSYAVQGKRSEALAAYRKGIESNLNDAIRDKYFAPNDIVPYLNTLIGAAAADPSQADALYAEALRAVQVPRSTTTAAAITNMTARLASDDPKTGTVVRELQDALATETRLTDDLTTAAGLPPEQRNPAEEDRMRGELQAAAARSKAAELHLQADFPRYAALVAPKPIDASALSKALRPDEALLDLFVTQKATYIFLLRDGKVYLKRADISQDDLLGDVALLRASTDSSEGQPPAFDLQQAYNLYQKLVQPVAGDGFKGLRRLYVVPTGPLLSLPLSMLLTKSPVSTGPKPNYGAEPWLVRTVAMTIAPSIASVVELKANAAHNQAPKPFIGFGDPDYTGAAGATRSVEALANACRDGTFDEALLRGLPRLKETADELRGIAATLKAPASDVFLGPQASETTVRSTDLSDYRVVAFATHGLLPDELRCKNEPALALSPPAHVTPQDDGLLNASAIAELKLNADWVLLSACNTAGPDGKLGGEALSGLARAFFYAGARTVMAAHWPVVSAPTVKLTTMTFEAYAKHPEAGKAAALRQAQLSLLSNPATAHPLYWAAFVLVGDDG